MAEKDQISAERIESISMRSSVQESVRETGNEDDKASDQEIENNVSQEKDMKQSLEMDNDTGVCNMAMRIMHFSFHPQGGREIRSDLALNGDSETKGFVESSKNPHTVAEKDQVSAERKDIHMGSSVQESVREAGNENDKASDQETENDVSQEEEME